MKRIHYAVRGKRYKNRVQGNSRVQIQSIESKDDVDSVQGAEGRTTMMNAICASTCVLSWIYYLHLHNLSVVFSTSICCLLCFYFNYTWPIDLLGQKVLPTDVLLRHLIDVATQNQLSLSGSRFLTIVFGTSVPKWNVEIKFHYPFWLPNWNAEIWVHCSFWNFHTQIKKPKVCSIIYFRTSASNLIRQSNFSTIHFAP